MQKRSLLIFISLLVLLIGLVPAMAQEEETEPAPHLFYTVPGGYQITRSLTNDNVRLEKENEVVLIFGPNSYAQIIGGQTFETDAEELAFFADRSGYQVGEALENLPDKASAGIRVSLGRRQQQGYAYLIPVDGGLHTAVFSFHTGRGQVGAPIADLNTVLNAYAFPLDVVQVLEYKGNFTTLLAAIDAAGLRETLKGRGPFTIFAPTDDAFAELLTATGLTAEQVLSSDLLSDILLYHVVSGNVDSAAVAEYVDVDSIPTLLELNNIFVFTGSDGGLYINNNQVKITDTDLGGTNGVVHVIDSVLLPQEALDAFFGSEEAPATESGS